MLHQTRISLLVVAIALLIFTSSANGQQCMSSVKNTAVEEGDRDTIMGLSTNPQNVSWKVQPTTNETDTYTIIDYDGVIDTTLIRLYDVNQAGLIIKEATTVEYEDGFPISTAGLYIGQCANNPNRTGAKLLVVRKSPECSCAPINSTASTVSCKVTYADHSIQPIYPIVTWKLNGVFLSSSTLPRTRVVGAYVFYAESTNYTDSPGVYTCELTFSAPTVTDIQFAYVATNAPEFNKSCSTSIVCGQKITASPTTTTQPTTTRKLIITTNKELSTSTTPPATTTQTPKTTQPSRTTATKILTAATHTSPPTSKSPTTATNAQTTTLRTLSTTSKQMTQTSPKTSEPHITTPMKSRTATSLTTATTPKSSAVTADHFISTGSPTTTTQPTTTTDKVFIGANTGTSGLSRGGIIGIGVGIGVVGILVVGGIIFAVLCRRHMYESIKKFKIGGDNSSAADYASLNVPTNSRRVYEQFATATTVDVGQYSISEAATHDNYYDTLNANEPFSTEPQSLENTDLPLSDETGTEGMLNMGSEDGDNLSDGYYEPLNVPSNSRPVCEQTTSATTVDAGQYILSEGATHQNVEGMLNENETTESQSIQNIDISPSDETGTEGMLNMGSEGRDNSRAAHYEPLKVPSNPGPVYAQITTATTVDVGQYSLSEAATHENVYGRLSANETTESQGLQNMELPTSDEYETIVK